MRNSTLLPGAKHVIVPEGIELTGYPSIAATLADIGVFYDPWQVDLARLVLGKTKSGAYATDTVGFSIARQVGKTFLVGTLVFADCIINPGTVVGWTAHRFKVARETFNSLVSLARLPGMDAHIDPDAITTGAGNEVINFRNGSKIAIASRDRGGLRGIPKIRRMVLDEGQILTEHAMADTVPTMNQAENPQMIIMGTPPKPQDESEVFSRMRREALAGNPDNILWVEFGADPGQGLDDDDAWVAANPSYPDRTPAAALRRMRKNLTEDDFRREALGVWDSDSQSRVISESVWAGSVGVPASGEGVRVFGVDMAPDRSALSIVGCLRHEGGVFFELVKYGRADEGFSWVAPWLAARRSQVAAVVIDSMSPARSFIPQLREFRVPVRVTNSTDLATAWGLFMDGLDSGRVTHPAGQGALDVAVANATTRPVGSAGGKSWDRRDKGVDISPLVAATVGVFGAETEKRKPGRRSVAIV